MPKPKRSADNYIHLNKKITDKESIKLIDDIAAEEGVPRKDAVYLFFFRCLKREKERRKLATK